MMDDTISATAVLTALAFAQAHGGAAAAPRVAGFVVDDLGRFDAVPEDIGHVSGDSIGAGAVGEALALGFLAGRVAGHPGRPTSFDPSSFLMDHDLLVRGAQGQSILRLPWFDEGLFVGRPVADIGEMPADVRNLCVYHYRAALAGDRGRFAFCSYGHAYTVDAIPVRGFDDSVIAVLGVAVPAARLRAESRWKHLTTREIEILSLASRGMSGPEIAEHLVLSPATVKTHFQNIYGKWSVSDRTSAVAAALRRGLID
jgi:DNA-binding CsgD family transcriptional regulator